MKEFKNLKTMHFLKNGDNLSTASKLKEIEQRLKIETTLREKNFIMYVQLNKDLGMSGSNKEIRMRLKNQLLIIDQKIKELELIRLYLRVS